MSHLLPAERVRGEVGMVAVTVRRAARIPPRLRKRDSTLAGRCDEMLAAFDHERWPALVERATGLNRALLDWSTAEKRARRYRRRLRPPQTLPAAEGRTRRRPESFAQVLDLGKEAKWCLITSKSFAENVAARHPNREVACDR